MHIGESASTRKDVRNSIYNALTKTHELVKRYLGASRIENKPPRVTKDGRTSDVQANDHVAEEQPLAYERLAAVSWWYSHDGMVRRVESEGGCRQTVRYQVNPQQLYGNQCFWHA